MSEEEPSGEEEPTEVTEPSEEEEAPAPVEEARKVPNIFVVEAEPHTGSLTGPRVLVVVDEGKAYPMDESANGFVRQHNVPILAKMPEGIKLEGATTYADLAELTKKLEAQT